MKYAADREYQASQDRLQLFREQYQQARADLQPWRESGLQALKQVNAINRGDGNIYKEFTIPGADQLQQDPGYRFRLSEMERGLRRQYGKGGQTGAFGKALVGYGQQLASQEYGNMFDRHRTAYGINYGRAVDRYNRLAGLAGVGQQTSMQMANLGQQSAQMQGQALMQGAQAQGAGQVGYQNALLSGQMAQYNADIAHQNQMMQLGLGLGGLALGAWSGGMFGGGAAAGTAAPWMARQQSPYWS